MVGADHDRVAVEELLRPTRRRHQLSHARVGPLQSRERVLRADDVGGVVVVGEVEDEEVEAVARD